MKIELFVIGARLWLGAAAIGLFGMMIGTTGWIGEIHKRRAVAQKNGLLGLHTLINNRREMTFATVSFTTICIAFVTIVGVLIVI